MRKDTRPSPTLPYWKRRKAGQVLSMRLAFPHTATLRPVVTVSLISQTLTGRAVAPSSSTLATKDPSSSSGITLALCWSWHKNSRLWLSLLSMWVLWYLGAVWGGRRSWWWSKEWYATEGLERGVLYTCTCSTPLHSLSTPNVYVHPTSNVHTQHVLCLVESLTVACGYLFGAPKAVSN